MRRTLITGGAGFIGTHLARRLVERGESVDLVDNLSRGSADRDLESLTCLVIILYDSPNIASCPYHEHGDLVDAIEARDAERAAEQMVTHLNHVESTLDLYISSAGEVDLDAVFS